MGGMSFWHWVIVALVILVLFGRGKISEMMGDFGKGVSQLQEGAGRDRGRDQARRADLAAASRAPAVRPRRVRATGRGDRDQRPEPVARLRDRWTSERGRR